METAACPLQIYESVFEHPYSSHRDLQNYMVWRFAMNMVVGLSKAYRDTRKALRKVRCQNLWIKTKSS